MLSYGTETFWGRAGGKWDFIAPENLKLTTELAADFREPLVDEAASGYERFYGYFRARKEWPEARGTIKLANEGKNYSGQTTYSYDYNLTRFRLDFGFPFFGDDELSLGYQFAFRYVPDTTSANYHKNTMLGGVNSGVAIISISISMPNDAYITGVTLPATIGGFISRPNRGSGLARGLLLFRR